jgi:hypothetical protein
MDAKPLQPWRRLNPAGWLLLVLLVGGLPVQATFAQPPSAMLLPESDLKQNWIGLSASVPVKLVIEGAAPLRVELPEPLLSSETALNWHIRPTGPATVSPTGPQRETWTQPFRLTPFVPGHHVVQFRPITVNGLATTVTGFPVEVKVESAITDQPDPRQARPVTGIEELPPHASDSPVSSQQKWWILGGLLALVVATLAVWRFRRPPAPIPPESWARTAFDQLEQSGSPDAVVVDQVAAIVREFLDRRFGIPAPRLTTSELLATITAANWPARIAEPLQHLLQVCDQAKFAGRVPDAAGCRHLLAAGRDWVQTLAAELSGHAAESRTGSSP